MRQWRCHKTVLAERIEAILPPLNYFDKWELKLEGNHSAFVRSGWVYAQEAKTGGYFVRDSDGEYFMDPDKFEAEHEEIREAKGPAVKGWENAHE